MNDAHHLRAKAVKVAKGAGRFAKRLVVDAIEAHGYDEAANIACGVVNARIQELEATAGPGKKLTAANHALVSELRRLQGDVARALTERDDERKRKAIHGTDD